MASPPPEPMGVPATTTSRDPSAPPASAAGPVEPARRRSAYGALWTARLRMMRPGNALMAAIGVLVGIAVVPHGSLPLATWIAAPLSAFLLAGFGNVLNDLRDQAIDARAHPGRALPSGAISRGAATAWAAALLALGLWEAYLAAGWPTLAFASANAVALAAYEAWFKRMGLPGNVLVAALVASTFAFGALATGVPPAEWGLLWLLMAMAFLANVAREVLKDIEDMAADSGTRSSLPLQVGSGPARLVAFFVVNAAVLLSLLAFFESPAGWSAPWLALLAGADLLLVVGSALAWMDVGQAQRVLKLGMATALAAFLAGPLLP